MQVLRLPVWHPAPGRAGAHRRAAGAGVRAAALARALTKP